MRRSSNCSTWRCATSRRNGPCRCTTGKQPSTALPSSTKTDCQLNSGEIEEMKLPGKIRAMETVEKQTAFSHRSHSPLLLVINQDEKRPNLNNRRSFTQNI